MTDTSLTDTSLLDSLLNADDDLARENAKLKRIVIKLMARVEQATNDRSPGYIHFERAIALEEQIRLRTQHLQEALDVLNATNLQLSERTRELRTARDIAQIANASKSRFVAAVSHDLLQPVNAAKLFISSLENTPLNERQVILVERISKSFQSVETILGALLDISKLDSGQAALNISEFGIQSVLDGIRNEFRPQAREKGLSLKVIPCSAEVRSDPVYLRRILQNLVANAIRYTRSGRILIGVRRRKYFAEFQVSDTGIGIAEEEQDRVFEEFHRIDRQLVSDSAMGLGLTIVKRACDMLEHELTLRSTLARGSTFTISVPFAREKVKAQVEQEISFDSHLPPLLENAIIMVVENDFTVAEGMEHVLESWGATPVIVTSLEQAFSQIEELDILPDIFLVDYHLDNEENGLNFITGMRQKFGVIRSILLTADRNPSIVSEANKQGVFVRYKPLDIPELYRLIANLISPAA